MFFWRSGRGLSREQTSKICEEGRSLLLRIGIAVLSVAIITASAQAGPVWVMEVVDDNPMNGAQGLSSSAVDFAGTPAVIYRKRDGFERPRLVMATRGATGSGIQTNAAAR